MAKVDGEYWLHQTLMEHGYQSLQDIPFSDFGLWRDMLLDWEFPPMGALSQDADALLDAFED